MAGVDIKYKGNSIASIQGSGSKTLKTEGKYCEGDIHVDYVKEGITPSGTKNISTNGTHDVTDYASANVSVSPNVGSKNVSANGTYNASSDSLDGYSQVNVSVPPNVTSKSIGANGTYNASSDNVDGYDVVTVDIQPYFSTSGAMYFEEMKIPNTVTVIKNNAYQGCSDINKLEITGNVETIGNYAFDGSHITSLELKNGVKTVGTRAFRYHKCTELKLPSSITSIGSEAFSSTERDQIIDLSEFTDPNNIPTLNNSSAFNNVVVLRYEVANQSMLDAFAAATNWSTYSGKYVIKGAS